MTLALASNKPVCLHTWLLKTAAAPRNKARTCLQIAHGAREDLCMAPRGASSPSKAPAKQKVALANSSSPSVPFTVLGSLVLTLPV